MQKSLALSFFLLAIANCLAAQTTFTIPEFLNGAQGQETVVFQKSKLAYLNQISHELPWVEKLEIRTETNQFDFRQQQYALRVSPNSRRAIVTQRQFQQSNRHLAELEISAELNDALRYRYELLAKYLGFHRQLATLQKLKLLYADQVSVLKKSVNLPSFDILQLIEAEDDEQAVTREIFNLETAIRSMEKEMKRKTNSEKTLSFQAEKLAGVPQVKAFLAAHVVPELNSHLALQTLSAEKYGNALRYDWEATRTRFTLSYLQVRYGYDPNDNFSKGFTVGVGFDLPLRGAARLDLNEIQLQIYELESQFRSMKSHLAEQKIALGERLGNLVSQHELVERQINESRAELALNEYQKLAETSPLALLRLRENTLKKELILQELELETLLAFIEYLDVAGLLSKRPLRNFMSQDFDVLN